MENVIAPANNDNKGIWVTIHGVFLLTYNIKQKGNPLIIGMY